MEQTWIKIYRKLIDHPLFMDESAFRVFIWVLLTVNYKTGEMRSGRFRAAELLGIKPSTYQKILKRLEKKYDLVSLTSNNKNTLISVKNWASYQQDGITKSINKVSPKYHQSITIQEYNNKEYINNYEDEARKWLEVYKVVRREPNRKSSAPFIKNFIYWRKIYSLEEMIEAIKSIKPGSFHDEAMSPEYFFRTRNKNGDCDYIGDILNQKTELQKSLGGDNVL